MAKINLPKKCGFGVTKYGLVKIFQSKNCQGIKKFIVKVFNFLM